jgi:hypothetical protein
MAGFAAKKTPTTNSPMEIKARRPPGNEAETNLLLLAIVLSVPLALS